MDGKQRQDGIVSDRLDATAYQDNFQDLHPPLASHEALVASDRCYFCYDAPCMTACPTAIDIPMFIRQISTGNTEGAAKTIFDQNILGGMCARVCPTETLCEQACVREAAVLGMLGVISLGYLITDAKSARAFDQMVFFILLGAVIVLAGDLLSALVRRWLRFERV